VRAASREARIDLGAGGNEAIPDHLPDTVRAQRTRAVLDRMLAGDRSVVLLSQATLAFGFAGGTAMIRPDAVAIIPADDELMVAELKGFRSGPAISPARRSLGRSARLRCTRRRCDASPSTWATTRR
jgi:hypothetical protein